jgi:hypothetical protein
MTAAAVVPHYLVAKLFHDQTPAQIKRICERAGVQYPTVREWIFAKRSARIDLFCKCANAAGYEVGLFRVQPPLETLEQPAMTRKPSNHAATSKLRIFDRNGRIEVMDGGKLAGYVDGDILSAIDKDGYAVEVGPINHRVEIIGKLENWRSKPSAAA